MSKNNLSENKNQGAAASRSRFIQKDLDTEQRFIDDLMTVKRRNSQTSKTLMEHCFHTGTLDRLFDES